MVLASRRERVYQKFPDPVGGYELDPELGYFSVILPEATTNLVTNPSCETGVRTNWTEVVGFANVISTWQAYGSYGIKLEPIALNECGIYYGTVTLAAGTTYTASVTIQGEEGKIYYIWFAADPGGALIGTKRAWIGTGHKQRIWITHTETAGAARRVYITRDARYNDTNLFYVDALQVEAKSYPTTYCDGDQVGFLVNETPAPYLWTGTRRASASTRSAQTRSGGREVSLLSLGLHVLTVLGLGMSPLVDQALPMPGRGELAQGTGTTAREFTLVTALYADGPGPRHLQALRSGLIDAFKPDLVTLNQPLILRYQACDDEGDPLGESLDIICKYQSGLEGNWDNHQQERLPITFKMHLPLIQNTYDSGAALGYQTSIAVFNNVGYRDTDGVWTAMGTGADDVVYVLAAGPDGSVYAGGAFGSVNGVANTAQIARWSGGAWSALGNGLSVVVNALAFGADGSLYIGGGFQNAGGVAAADYITKWDGANYTALGTGMDNQVLAIAIGPDGTLYAGGLFHLAGGVADTVHIAMWKNGTWYPMGTGMDDVVDAIKIGPDGYVYATGDFATAGGVTVNGIARWNGVQWGPLGSGLTGDGRTLTFGLDGTLFVGGIFTAAGGVPDTAYLARWNGQVWSSIGVLDNYVYTLNTGPDGKIYVGGAFSRVNGIVPPDSLMAWFNNTWIPMDINLSGVAPYIYSTVFDTAGRFYIAGPFSSAVSATVAVPNLGSSTAYPIVTFTGPGTVYQLKNYTTGKAIYFDLTLLAGETAILNLNPINPSFISSFRGDIWNDAILPGSNLVFLLLPGVNNISSYIFGGTTAATAISMTWRPQYWSLDGAAWK